MGAVRMEDSLGWGDGVESWQCQGRCGLEGTFNLGRPDPGMAIARRPSLRDCTRKATGEDQQSHGWKDTRKTHFSGQLSYCGLPKPGGPLTSVTTRPNLQSPWQECGRRVS